MFADKMKGQVPREARKPRAHNRSKQQDSLMSARQRQLGKPGTCGFAANFPQTWHG